MLYKKNWTKLAKKKNKHKLLKSGLKSHVKFNHSMKVAHILIPIKWKCTVFKDFKKDFYVFHLKSLEYYFKFALTTDGTYVVYCPNTNLVTLVNRNWKTLITMWCNTVNTILYLFYSFLFIKLKFKGKGYYIYKNYRNTIAPQFGYYHRIYIYSFFNKVKFLSKTKILLFGLVKQDILCAAYALKQKRSINIFTGRGVRFAKQIIYKKTGKVSSYR